MSDETTEAVTESGTAPDPAEALSAAAAQPVTELAGKLTQLPAGVKLATNLDTYEKERPEKPFWFQHGGTYFRLMDPEDVDFDDIVIVQENPRLMMHILMDEDQRVSYFEVTKTHKMTVGKMKKLISEYNQHFGMTDLGELAGSARR